MRKIKLEPTETSISTVLKLSLESKRIKAEAEAANAEWHSRISPLDAFDARPSRETLYPDRDDQLLEARQTVQRVRAIAPHLLHGFEPTYQGPEPAKLDRGREKARNKEEERQEQYFKLREAELQVKDQRIAIESYTSQRPDELSFKKGDKIGLLGPAGDEGWFRAVINGTHGIVPHNYLSPPGANGLRLNTAHLRVAAIWTAIQSYAPTRRDELPFQKGQKISIISPAVDPGWLQAVIDGREGVVPYNFMQEAYLMQEGGASPQGEEAVVDGSV